MQKARKKIILTTVNAKQSLYAATANIYSAVAPNIQLGLLASYLQSKNIEVQVIEADVDNILIPELIQIIEREKPLLCGFICSGANPSSSTMVMDGIVEFFKEYKPHDDLVNTFIWGPHPTVLPERSLKETGATFIVRGEGYEAIEKLYKHLDNNASKEALMDIPGLSFIKDDPVYSKKEYVHTDDAPLMKNLDDLPFVNWDLMDPSKYRAHNWHCFDDISGRSPYAILWTSFGCPFNCNYCSINNLFGKRIQRFRSIEKVVEELDILVNKHGVKHIKILDELFVINEKRVLKFCDLLDERKYDINMWAYSRVDTINENLLHRLKKVGMNWISYGFESISSQILKDADKGCKTDYASVIKMTQNAGISICADVMYGLWNDTPETIEETYNFLVKYNFEWANIYPVFAYPGTVLYDKIEEPINWKRYSLYGYECVPMPTKTMSSKEVLKARDEAFVKYYSRPEYLKMIEKKFGVETKEHIQNMVKVPLKRRILEED